MKKALITGINGQDASYLAELLIDKGYEVHGTTRRNSILENQNPRVDHIKKKIKIHYADLTDVVSFLALVNKIKPDEIYNLGAQSDVRISFEQPLYTSNVNAISVLNLLEIIRTTCPQSKFYQAGSSEMFGNSLDPDGFQRETTKMLPVSPYGISKLFAHNTTIYYRDRYNMFACNGIFFNHESSRRGTNFVTNKVVKAAAMIKKGLISELTLGNLDATRDWGHSKDYVRAMWMIMQQDQPSDYVCATGISHSVRDMVNYVFGKLELDWTKHVICDPVLYRNPELCNLRGDSSRLRNIVKWQPEYTFETMLDEMIDYWKNSI
jgi:GDPmannose 4,6-dehydratase